VARGQAGGGGAREQGRGEGRRERKKEGKRNERKKGKEIGGREKRREKRRGASAPVAAASVACRPRARDSRAARERNRAGANRGG
jgi:hypothetical protein